MDAGDPGCSFGIVFLDHRKIEWVGFGLWGAGIRLFFGMKSTSPAAENLSRCCDGENQTTARCLPVSWFRPAGSSSRRLR
jgi:hypothetical protein